MINHSTDLVNIMSLTEKIDRLNEAQRSSLHFTLLRASHAIQDGHCHKEVFRKARHRHIGIMKSIHGMLHDVSREDIVRLADQIDLSIKTQQEQIDE